MNNIKWKCRFHQSIDSRHEFGVNCIMLKEHLNYEKNIIESFRLLFSNPNYPQNHPLYFPETDSVKQVFHSICDDIQWAKWSDSSGKIDPPPDYYNNELKLMMEVMRVDDNACIDKSTGKLINPLRARESEMIHELRDNGFFDICPNVKNVIITAKTKLPIDEDHNYIFYRDNFMRVIENHKKKIPSYLQNHPGFKIIFYVFDDSSMYIKLADGYSTQSINKKSDNALGQLHFWWMDNAFLDVIINSEIDFLIWETPYKQAKCKGGDEVKLPDVCIFDVKNMNLETITYPERRMVSTEE